MKNIKTNINDFISEQQKSVAWYFPNGDPRIRWNIIEEQGYFGDEWDNWEHMEEDERFEYFKEVFSYFKKLKEENERYKKILDDNNMFGPLFPKK